VGDANLLLPYFYVLPAFSSQLSVFSKLCTMNTLMNFLLLLCQSCRSLRNVSFGGRILALIKCACHSWLTIMDVIRGAPYFTLASSLPTLNLPLSVGTSFSATLRPTSQRCTESEIFDFDSTPASAEYTLTPLRLQTIFKFWIPTPA